jgi:hypothetical protein
MKKPQPGDTWFFVDESGDPVFYDRRGNLIVGQEGCSPLLLLGFVEIRNPDAARRAILDLQREIVDDPYFQGFPSLKRTAIAFHATDDLPEIRYRFFKLLGSLEFVAQFAVARKIERVFRNSFNAQENAFYDHLVTQLFQNMLHRFENNRICFAKRGSRPRQAPLVKAVEQGKRRFEEKWGVHVSTSVRVQAQTPQGEPCLSIVDYMNWAVYQAFVRREMRYFRTVEEKVALLLDLYDIEKYPKNWYTRKNPFDTSKITPL